MRIACSRGMTLLELTIAASLLVLTLWAGAMVYRNFNDARLGQETTMKESSEAGVFLKLLTQVGRLANSCAIVPALAPDTILQCEVQFDITKVAPVQSVRFYYDSVNERFNYQWLVGGVWENRLFLGSANDEFSTQAFTVCNSAAIRAQTCPWMNGAAISLSPRYGIAYNATVTSASPGAAAADGRLFAYQLTVRNSRTAKRTTFQSAFFVRNPTGIGGVTFDWGTEDN